MKQIRLCLLIMTFIWAFASHGQAQSVSYKISVTIPPIIGVNTPETRQDPDLKDHRAAYNTDITSEEVWRDQQKIVLRTVVLDE